MNIALIFAGGIGKRMHSKDRPKQFLKMHGKPIIIHTIEVFESHPEIDAIVVVCVEGWIEYLEKQIERYGIHKVRKIVPGGKNGQQSIYHGLVAAEEISDDENTIVLIHDGVRPLINHQLISDNIKSVKEHGSAITCVPVIETVLEVGSENEITRIPMRKDTRLARAPQSFLLKDILEIHRTALRDGIEDSIDSCTLMQHYGKKLYLIEGPVENIKITTPQDFYIMRAMLDAKENAQIYGFDEGE